MRLEGESDVTRHSIREAFDIAAWATVFYALMIGGAYAADAVLQTDLLSRLYPEVVGALGGVAGGTIRAMRAEVPTVRALLMDAFPGGLAGLFAWPVTLAIFGPVLSTLQTTTDVVLTIGAKIGVAGLITGVCLSLLIGFLESIFDKAIRKERE